ncbi:MAG: LLM class flavin-dependent oxidoreductase [Rhizobiales bacterium]|nr:LLM class flavin-dependent oxidoreductase [Hyphomicrobiales bacterium]OJU34962.1 MAG: hypothetical protein BGN94_03520 [Rhizobiales bacterium 68-8]
MEYYGFTLTPAREGQSHAQRYAELFSTVEIADRSHFDGWFFAEHHGEASFSLLPSPNLVIAALSQRTRRLQLGNLVNLIPFHHPYRLAAEIRMLDTFTGGRLEVGFGRGQVRTEQAAFGTDRSATVDMFDAGFDIIRRLLLGERIDYDTPWWKGSNAFVTPEPTQRPHPPFWLSAASDSSIEKAARLGMYCATALLSRKVSDTHMAEYRRHWDRCNPDRKGQGKFSITADVAIGRTFDEAYAQVAHHFDKRKEHFSRSITDRPGDNDETYRTHRPNYEAFAKSSIEDMLENHLLVAGTVDQCIEQVTAIRNRGIDVVNLSFSANDPDFARRSVELFGSEVIPAVEGLRAKAV